MVGLALWVLRHAAVKLESPLAYWQEALVVSTEGGAVGGERRYGDGCGWR